MSVEVAYNFRLDGDETVEFDQDLYPNPSVAHTRAYAGTWTSITTPKAEEIWSDQIQLSAGAYTIDLTALVRGAERPDLDATGLAITAIKVVSADANTDDITIVSGASNGYDFMNADASGRVTLSPGDALVLRTNGNGAVGAADAEIDLSSSDTDAVFDIIIMFGTP